MIRTGLPGKPWGSAADGVPVSASAATAATNGDRCAAAETAKTRSSGARSPASLFDHLVSKRDQPIRDGQSERPGGLEIERQLELLDRQIGGSAAAKNLGVRHRRDGLRAAI